MLRASPLELTSVVDDSARVRRYDLKRGELRNTLCENKSGNKHLISDFKLDAKLDRNYEREEFKAVQ